MQRAFFYVAVAFGVASAFPSGAIAGEFQEVTGSVGFIQEVKKSYGNPIFGDMNNDGFLDLIVPCHGLTASGGPFVYLNNGGTSFTDIRSTCGIQEAPELDSTDWHGISFGDYDGDGNIDVYIAEGAKMGAEMKRDLLFRGLGDGTFTYVSDVVGLITSTDRGRQGFFIDYDNDGKLDLFVKNSYSSNRLYKNVGNGSFVETTSTSGLVVTIGPACGNGLRARRRSAPPDRYRSGVQLVPASTELPNRITWAPDEPPTRQVQPWTPRQSTRCIAPRACRSAATRSATSRFTLRTRSPRPSSTLR